MFKLLLVIISPAVAFFIYFFHRDKYEKEPLGLLLKAFSVGLILLALAIILEIPLLNLLRLLSLPALLNAFLVSFIVAGLIEEVLKFVAFMLFIYPHREFNELYDGIIYAVMLSLGFATAENILRLVPFYHTQLFGFIVFVRTLFSLPAHIFCGIIMGYYLAKARFSGGEKRKTLLLKGLFLAIFFHGSYNFFWFLFGYLAIPLCGLFLPFALSLSRRLISQHLEGGCSKRDLFWPKK